MQEILQRFIWLSGYWLWGIVLAGQVFLFSVLYQILLSPQLAIFHQQSAELEHLMTRFQQLPAEYRRYPPLRVIKEALMKIAHPPGKTLEQLVLSRGSGVVSWRGDESHGRRLHIAVPWSEFIGLQQTMLQMQLAGFPAVIEIRREEKQLSVRIQFDDTPP